MAEMNIVVLLLVGIFTLIPPFSLKGEGTSEVQTDKIGLHIELGT